MDLYAYANIENLEGILTDLNIEIRRLRGLRLMKDQEPTSQKDIEETIRDAKISYAKDWLQQHSDCIWSSDKADRKHPAFIYSEPNPFEPQEVIDIDLTKVHGKDKNKIKLEWKHIEKAYRKEYETFNKYCGKDVLYVHARQGGGNRSAYPIDTQHPRYLEDLDDAFDCTYCDIYYDLKDFDYSKYIKNDKKEVE